MEVIFIQRLRPSFLSVSTGGPQLLLVSHLSPESTCKVSGMVRPISRFQNQGVLCAETFLGS